MIPGTVQITGGLHWRHIRPTTCTQMQVQALAHPYYHCECSRSVTLYKMLVLSSLTVATFIQEEYVGLLLSFNICWQLIITVCSVGREYIGCHTIILLCLLCCTSVTKCWVGKKKWEWLFSVIVVTALIWELKSENYYYYDSVAAWQWVSFMFGLWMSSYLKNPPQFISTSLFFDKVISYLSKCWQYLLIDPVAIL